MSGAPAEPSQQARNGQTIGAVVLEAAAAAVVFVATYASCFSPEAIDYGVHIKSTMEIVTDGFASFSRHNQYPLWHLTTVLFYGLEHSSLDAAASASALFNTAAYFAVVRFLRHGSLLKPWLCSLGALAILFLGPVCGLDTIYWTPNTWHNPTQFAVRPFAVMSFLLMTAALESYQAGRPVNRRTLIDLALMTMLSNFAKPSYAQIILPGTLLVMAYYWKRDHSPATRRFIGQLAAAMVPCAAVTVFQFTWSFFRPAGVSTDGGITIAPFLHLFLSLGWKVWMLPLFILFPLYVLILDKPARKRADVKLLAACGISGFLEMVLLEETGARRGNGNFTWGYILAEFLAFMVAVKIFLETVHDYDHADPRQRRFVTFGWVLLAIHLFIGISYFVYFVQS